MLILSLFSMTPICLGNIHVTETKNIINKVEVSLSFSILNLHRPVINFYFSSYQKYWYIIISVVTLLVSTLLIRIDLSCVHYLSLDYK